MDQSFVIVSLSISDALSTRPQGHLKMIYLQIFFKEKLLLFLKDTVLDVPLPGSRVEFLLV